MNPPSAPAAVLVLHRRRPLARSEVPGMGEVNAVAPNRVPSGIGLTHLLRLSTAPCALILATKSQVDVACTMKRGRAVSLMVLTRPLVKARGPADHARVRP